MHTEPMKDSEGDFGEFKPASYPCPKCQQKTLTSRAWESSCGGFEDYQYKCTACGHSFWVDGPDA